MTNTLVFVSVYDFLLFLAVLGIRIYVFGPPGYGYVSTRYGCGSGSFYHQAKIVRKTVIPTVL
jgi:hypothetical protein